MLVLFAVVGGAVDSGTRMHGAGRAMPVFCVDVFSLRWMGREWSEYAWCFWWVVQIARGSNAGLGGQDPFSGAVPPVPEEPEAGPLWQSDGCGRHVGVWR